MKKIQIPNTIANEIIHSWCKPNTNPIDRAKFIKAFKKEKGLSDTVFAREFNVPLGTLKGWLCYDKLSKDQFTYLKEKGISTGLIHDTLKSSRVQGNEAVKTIMKRKEEKAHDFGILVQTMVDQLRPYILDPPKNENGTLLYLSKLKDIINTLERKIK